MATIYRALDTERREIRLLALHASASSDAVIQCSLRYAFLDAPPEYEALSYVWGPLEYAQEVLVDGQAVQITENLECALRHLRHVSQERIIWVDALCINQADILERNHQVTLMKEIYSHCSCDLAWLGPNPGTHRARSPAPSESTAAPAPEDGDQDNGATVLDRDLEKVQEGMRIFRKIYERDAATLDKMYRRQSDDADAKSDFFVLSYEQKRALFRLFTWAPLWSRMWVVQELSCAQRVRLIAGNETLDWKDVAAFIAKDNAPYADAFHVVGGHSTINRIMVTIFGRVQTIQQQRRIVKDIQMNGYHSKLMDVLARFQYADARDPRDLIYALLGLVSERHTIKVDYSKPIETLFLDVTKLFIDQSANLDIICQNPWDIDAKPDEQNLELPSWVANFAHRQRFSHFEDGLESMLFAQRGIFSAGSDSCPVPCKVSPGGLLHVNGVILDEVRPVLRTTSEGDLMAWAQEWSQLYFEGELGLAGDDAAIYKLTGEPLFRAYWRTLAMDCSSYPIKRLTPDVLSSDERLFVKFVLSNTTGKTYDPSEQTSLYDMQSLYMLRRSQTHWLFAMSKTGLLLMVGKAAQAGDVIAILDGAKVPCLLRPCPDNGHEMRYRLISTVYVHGYMDGKAATDVEQGLLQRREMLLA